MTLPAISKIQRYALLLATGAILANVVVWLLWLDNSNVNRVRLNEAGRIEACRNEAITLIKPDRVDVVLLERISDYCYGRVRGEDLIGDFNIRRSSFLRQQFEGRVILWMVLTITLSGVALAGLQLLAAYRLAAAGGGELAQSQELTLEQNKISLKSSVTGLFILVVSFAFFTVYVAWVFSTKESTAASERHIRNDGAQTLLPGIGGVGAPPTQPLNPSPQSK